MERKSLFVPNVHCPTCVEAITTLLSSPPLNCVDVSVSILTHTVTYTTGKSSTSSSSFTSNDRAVSKALAHAGFPPQQSDRDVEGAAPLVAPSGDAKTRRPWFETKKSRMQREAREAEQRWRAHLDACKACQQAERDRNLSSDKSTLDSIITEKDPPLSKSGIYKTVIDLDGLTCSACTSAIEGLLKPGKRGVIDRSVTLIPQRVEILHDATAKPEDFVDLIEDAGYGAIVQSSDCKDPTSAAAKDLVWTESKIEVGGMTCASCVSAVGDLFKSDRPGLRSFDITLFPPVATVVHDTNLLDTDAVMESIEDGGYEAKLLESKQLAKAGGRDTRRKVQVRVDGMFCNNCLESIQNLFTSKGVAFTHFSLSAPVTTLSYFPDSANGFTLRTIAAQVEDLGPFQLVPLTNSSSFSAAASSSRELRNLKWRLLVAFLFVIPTFIIAIVGASLVPMSKGFRQYWMAPIVGNSSRATVALFALSTPVQFIVGSIFYSRSYKSIRNVWRKGRSWTDRLFRWGSMDTLVALGTTIAWANSLGYMLLDMNEDPDDSGMGGEMSYFDTSVFLIFFILLGRVLEAISRRKTSEAIDRLADLKPQEGLLLPRATTVDPDKVSLEDAGIKKVNVKFLEIGDKILVPSGAAVPVDATISLESGSSAFNEASLTGEARPISKGPGDAILGGTTNVGSRPVIAEVSSNPEDSMIDSIVRVVRDAMSKKASIERLADKVTAFFVPAIVAISLLTFLIWLSEGYAGVLPDRWVETDELRRGGWALFAMKFAVATLVVACPCGIGLAAPTAQMVGIGMAARLGIVPYGGGEAFQNATNIDAVVFDKTGTLTSGTFTVTDSAIFVTQTPVDETALWRLTAAIEDASSHPLAVGVRAFASERLKGASVESQVSTQDIEEVAGRGLSATVKLADDSSVQAFVGNLRFMQEQHAKEDSVLSTEQLETVRKWSEEAKSVVFVGLRRSAGEPLVVAAMLAVEDPPRPEAAAVIEALRKRGIASFMCTGDNESTAKAVARSVGIEEANVMAGLLPEGKRESIERLQAGSAHDRIVALRTNRSMFQRFMARRRDEKEKSALRDRVAFCGDGINDGPSLASSDVGISMGSGSALAMTSSDFCLLTSNLTGLLTVLSLARATYNKILTNFAWACVFNAALIPLAAGAFYFLGETRLPPVWASLAMATSSLSVVCNALLLRVTFKVPRDARTTAL